MPDDLNRIAPEDRLWFNTNQQHEIDAMIDSIQKDRPDISREDISAAVHAEIGGTRFKTRRDVFKANVLKRLR